MLRPGLQQDRCLAVLGAALHVPGLGDGPWLQSQVLGCSGRVCRRKKTSIIPASCSPGLDSGAGRGPGHTRGWALVSLAPAFREQSPRLQHPAAPCGCGHRPGRGRGKEPVLTGALPSSWKTLTRSGAGSRKPGPAHMSWGFSRKLLCPGSRGFGLQPDPSPCHVPGISPHKGSVRMQDAPRDVAMVQVN